MQSQIWSYIEVITTVLNLTEVHVQSRPWQKYMYIVGNGWNDHQPTLAFYIENICKLHNIITTVFEAMWNADCMNENVNHTSPGVYLRVIQWITGQLWKCVWNFSLIKINLHCLYFTGELLPFSYTNHDCWNRLFTYLLNKFYVYKSNIPSPNISYWAQLIWSGALFVNHHHKLYTVA
jgi:hypothetical protein